MKDDLYLITLLINLYNDVKHSLDNNYDIHEHKKYELKELQNLLKNSDTSYNSMIKVYIDYCFHNTRKDINELIILYKKAILKNQESVNIEIRINKTRIEYFFDA